MLENIEWTRVWRERVNESYPRVLIVGDSIMDGSKLHISRELSDCAAVSVFVTSKAVDNPYYWQELSLLLEQEGASYTVIYFNSGLHTGGMTPAEYAAYYRNMVLHLREAVPGAVLILGLSTPVTARRTDPAAADAPITPCMQYADADRTIRAFNESVCALGEELHLPVFDAYACVDGHAAWRTPDGYHYVEEGYRHLSHAIAETIRPYLK